MTVPLYEQANFPIFQNRMYASQEEARQCPRGDIRLIEDPQTGIICNVSFRPELMVYDEHYQNEQGNSKSFQEHLSRVADIVAGHLGRQRLVEVGCGKGYFLEILAERGMDITGFDPTYEGSNRLIRKEYFSHGILDRANGIVLRHVLEHVQHPIQFLEQIATANGNDGKIYIEVPCFDWISDHKAWFDIFYEHVNYFRLDDFHRMFGQVVESGRLFGGQYLYVVAELSSLRRPPPRTKLASLPDNFLASISSLGTANHGPRVIWGGASKGVIFALLMERNGNPVHTLIDINPAKQGKFVAATGLLVQAPEQVLPSLPPKSPIYVMNSNYMEEIMHMTHNAYTYIGVDHE